MLRKTETEVPMSPEKIDPKQLVGTFPGQGSQSPGMGKDLYNESVAARKVFEEADDALGMKFSEVMFDESGESKNKLKDTRYAQLAMLIHGVAAMRAFEEKTGIEASSLRFLAGHSVGEYTALVAARAVEFKDAVLTVYERGKSMREAGKLQEGSMAAILGLDISSLEKICEQTGAEIGNDNCDGQTVLSGSLVSLDEAIKLSKAQGAKIIPINVSGAFHSKLMLPAVEHMRKILETVKFQDPKTPIVSNVTEKPILKAGQIPDELLKQLCSRVRWNGSVKGMTNNGAKIFLEFGPGKVLTNLAKRITKDDESAINVGTMSAIRSFAL